MSQTTTLLSHLYAVVFDNGICKVGCSQRNVDSRIAIHTAAASCFGISVAATFEEVILVDSAHAWELRMIKEASSLAPCVHGNEWFKYSRRKVPKSPLDWKPKNHTTTKENP